MQEVRGFTIFILQIKHFNSAIPGMEKNSRGTGLNKHCKFLMLDFAFTNLQMERVEFRADHKNERSIAAMKVLAVL